MTIALIRLYLIFREGFFYCMNVQYVYVHVRVCVHVYVYHVFMSACVCVCVCSSVCVCVVCVWNSIVVGLTECMYIVRGQLFNNQQN